MKKILFLAAAFVAGFSSMAQPKAEEVMKLSTEKHDFGKIKVGVPVTTYFTITNTSDKPLVIESATAGCGCTTPEYSKEPIAPGGTSQLKVGYNAASIGHFDKEVTIKLAGITDPRKVMITGDVVEAPSANVVATTEVKNKTNIEPLTEVRPVDKTKIKSKTKKVSK